ncbi:T9SS sorting signal type C domain-containing protein [Flavobacterium sp. SUN052]|uniref:T9SS sorting signal type C domain-containing protein n=1 Tax=Flavobacterium sp. SUN052 TaxID=3002441 RepID=UPI00237EBB86|nr:T9SS sorting signal type C domain-containing protein [Flavobacterium sp. SUN052]MEC4003309.1 T9SS sorting signal type C domain-containing protein [Flavobacterium sp. SUN052]
MRIKILLVTLFIGLNSYSQLLQWNTFGNLGTETSKSSSLNDANLTVSNLVLGAGVTPIANANRLGGQDWFDAGDTAAGTTLAESVSGNDYIQFTVTPNSGFYFTLTSLVFAWDRSATGPNSVALRSSIDGYGTNIGVFTGLVGSQTTGNNLMISGVSTITTATTFRLYGYGATGTTGTGGFDTASNVVNVQLNGSTAAIGPCVVPLNQASAISFTNPSVNGATISWTNGASTSGSMVVIRPTISPILDPTPGTSYLANVNYATAGQIDTNNRVVYLGSGTTINVSGLLAETQYTATIYSYNAVDCYNTTAPITVDFYTLSVEPTAHSALACNTATTSSSVTLTCSAANTLGGDGYVILSKIGSAPTGVPIDGGVYAAGTVFGDATVVGYTNSLGTATSYVASGLNSSTTYYFSLIPFKQNSAIGGTYNYRTAAIIPTCTSTTTPGTPFITLANNGTQISASNVPQGTTNLILHKFQLSVATANTTLQGVTATTNSGSGTYAASDLVNLKVRYSVDNVLDIADATLSTKTLTLGPGLQVFPSFIPQIITVGTTGYIFITADIAAGAGVGNIIGLNAIVNGNLIFSSGTKSGTTTSGGLQTISQSAPNVPATFTKGCTSNTTQVLNWTPPATGTLDGYLLVVRAGASPNAVTSIVASSQAFNLDYSLAPTYGATTSRVLYIGTGAGIIAGSGAISTVTVTGLTAGVNYEFNLYAYKNNGGSTLYSTVTTTTQTIGLPNVTAPLSVAGNTTGTISWTNPSSTCFDEVMAVVTTAAGITFVPTGNGSAYSPSSIYTAPNQVVYLAASSLVNITGLTNGVTYYIEIFVRKGTDWSTGVEVSVTPSTTTIFKPGELLFVGFDGQYLGSGPNDQYMVATMVDIVPGSSFSIANSRYEAGAAANVRTDEWGGPGNDPSQAPGVTVFTYNGPGNITAGSVLVLNTNASNVFGYAGVITGTTVTDRTTDFTFAQPFTSSGAPNITTANGDGEQIYLLQGNFISDGTIDANQSNYYLAGRLLHGFTIKTGWVPLTSACSGVVGGGSNRQSRLPAELTCFNIESAISNTISGYYINSAQHGLTSVRNIIKAVANVSTNWVIGTARYTIDATSSASIRAGKTYLIGAGNPGGQWIGDSDTNWFNCANWESLTVPDNTIDVIVNAAATNNAIVNYTATYSDFYSDLAQCKNLSITGRSVNISASPLNKLEVYGNLSISSTGILDMSDGTTGTPDGQLYLYGNWTNSLDETYFKQGESTVYFKGTTPQIINNVSPVGTELFYNVVLDNDFDTSISNSLVAQGDLTTNTGKVIRIAPNNYITNYKKLIHNADLTIENNGQFIQVDETDLNTGTFTGTKFQVKRTAQVKNLDYVYWSAPTAGFSVSSIPTNYRYEWNTLNPNANGTIGNWNTPSTATMTKGRGYIARASNGASTPTALTTTFTGQPNNGQFTYPIYRGNYTGVDYDADPVDANNLLTTAFDDNWNLVGNPYPSAIDAMEFINLNTATNNVKIVGAIWVWKHGIDPTSNISPFYNTCTYNYTSNDYIKFNAMGSSEPTLFTGGKIGSGQGFMINMSDELSSGVPNPSGNTITFNNDLRTDASKGFYNNADFFRHSNNLVQQPEERHRIWLDIFNNNSGQLDRNLLGYATNATLGKDNLYDCFTRPKSEVSLFSLIDNKPYAIQGRPLPFNDNDLVPMGINIVQSGTHTIAINAVDGLFLQNQDIFLEDKLLNVIHNLKQTPYVFTSVIGTFNDRFIIRYTNTALSTNNSSLIENNVVVATNNAQVSIKSAYEKMTSVSIYDLLGREIVKKENVSENEIIFNNISAKNQALIVKIKLENDTIVTRKIIL